MSQLQKKKFQPKQGSLIQQAVFLLETKAPRLTKSLVKLRAKFVWMDRHKAQRTVTKLLALHGDQLANKIPDLAVWIESFRCYFALEPRNLPIFLSFMTSPIECLSNREQNPSSPQHPIALCVVKNDLRRLKMVVEHHRSLGIDKFAVLDNDSTDGTREWLLEQADIDVWLVRQKFQSLVKYGWINRLIAHYGFNRWYVYIDSDELLVYPGCEHINLHHLPSALDRKGQDRLAAIMLDQYSSQPLYSATLQNQPLQDQYNYFDRDSYTLTQGKRGPIIKGGPRKRVFSEKSEDSPLLIKYPLFKALPGMIFESAHYLFPYQQNSPIEGAILHYKFLDTDLKRHEQIAQDGNFQGGSREYKRYLKTYQDQQSVTFWGDQSEKYVNSESLRAVDLISQDVIAEQLP